MNRMSSWNAYMKTTSENTLTRARHKMLPSSYTRRLRTRDLIVHRTIEHPVNTYTKITSGSFTNTNIGQGQSKSRLAHLPRLMRESTRAQEDTRVSGQISQVLERLSMADKKTKAEESVYKKKLKAIIPEEKGDTPIPDGASLEKQRSKIGVVPTLKPIRETNENMFTPRLKRKGEGESKPQVKDTIANLTRERMMTITRRLLKDTRMMQCYKVNTSKLYVMPPILLEGTPAWSHDVKKQPFILAPIKSIRYSKWKYTRPEAGYIEIDLPTKVGRTKTDPFKYVRSEDTIRLSSSKLNTALVTVFMEGLNGANFGEDDLKPELNFDYLNDTLELVFTKFLRIPIIPMVYLSADEPCYIIKPNLPDLDPTSDTLFRACFLNQEENILSKISTTDCGLRFNALKVIHTLCRQDWRLQSLSVYQLKNALMHDIDFEIDHSRRWQRLTPDMCVQSIIKRLLYFVKKRRLPHFFQSDFNLFSRLSEKSLKFMETPLERLVSNEPQLLRDLQRASRTYESSDSSSDSENDQDSIWW